MKRATLRNLALTTAASLTLASVQTASAVPINGQYFEDPRCDVIPNTHLSHELGQFGFFPANEAFEWQFQATNLTVCVPNDGLQNDWNVQIRNVSGIPWRDLFFVVDLGGTFGNTDGTISDVIGAPAARTDAMRIDGTVTAGVNNNLLFESMAVDEIFAPGEIWRFNVSNYNVVDSTGVFQPPIFRSPGVFAGSSPVGTGGGNASIVAVPVPEPTTIGAIGLVAAALLMRRPRRDSN